MSPTRSRRFLAGQVQPRLRSWRSRLCARQSCGVPVEARAHIRLRGRVQGVGFRYATADEARRRSLSGWVRNLDSGGVEAVFEGTRSQVEGMLCWCEDG